MYGVSSQLICTLCIKCLEHLMFALAYITGVLHYSHFANEFSPAGACTQLITKVQSLHLFNYTIEKGQASLC